MQTLWMDQEDPFGIRGSRTRASIATPTAAITINAPEPYTLSKQFRRHSSYSYKIVINNQSHFCVYIFRKLLSCF